MDKPDKFFTGKHGTFISLSYVGYLEQQLDIKTLENIKGSNRLDELEQQLAASVPFAVLQKMCRERQSEGHCTMHIKNFRDCTKQNCTLLKGETDEC